jgi:hypothetical protein
MLEPDPNPVPAPELDPDPNPVPLMQKVSVPGLEGIAGSGSASRSISQRHGSADPDPHQNVMDPQHWFFQSAVSSDELD